MTGVGTTGAIRAVVRGEVQADGFCEAIVSRARELGVLGWERDGDDATILVHAEGDRRAVDELGEFLRAGPPPARVAGVQVEPVAIEGHEQFAIRGVSAGAFLVREYTEPGHHFDLLLEVGELMRSWTIPKGPSLDPAVKRFAVQAGEGVVASRPGPGAPGESAVANSPAPGVPAGGEGTAWDHGTYEQGGRVPWPEALARGHAVFVLHGEKLRGGFALQRTRAGAKSQWLLIKRRDHEARPGSDIVAERS